MLGSARNEEQPEAGSKRGYVNEMLPWQDVIVGGVDVASDKHLDIAKRNRFVLEKKLALKARRGEDEWADLPSGEGHNLPFAAMPTR